MKQFHCLLLFAGFVIASCSPSDVERTPNGVIVQIDTKDPTQARQVSLEVLGERLIHVSATPERRFSNKESLVVLPQRTKTDFSVEEKEDSVFVHTSKLTASVSRKTGVVRFIDNNQWPLTSGRRGAGTHVPAYRSRGYPRICCSTGIPFRC